MGGFFALLAALSMSVDNILMRKGLTEENPGSIWDMRFVITLTSLSLFLVGISIASILGNSILQEFKYLSFVSVILLILAGALGPLIGALFFSTAIAQVGSSHASALFAGSNPLFTLLFGIFFLGEMPDWIGLFSVLVIVSGIIVVGYHGHEGTVILLEKTKLSGGIVALFAGISVALSQIARGAALNLGATPNTSFLVYQSTALLIITIVCFRRSRNLKYLKHISIKSIYCYSGAGVGMLIGSYCLLTSFTLIPVWQAAAINNIQPILVIVLSWLFLKKVDKVNLRLVSGATLVTLGVVILNVY